MGKRLNGTIELFIAKKLFLLTKIIHTVEVSDILIENANVFFLFCLCFDTVVSVVKRDSDENKSEEEQKQTSY